MAKQLAFYIDTSICTGCKTCQVACKDKNNLPIDISLRRVFNYGGGGWTRVENAWVPNRVFGYSVSISCQHCQNPACVTACPTTAMHKDENGIVSIDPDKCIGCQYCEWSCPYGAPHFNEEAGVMTKCDFCKDLLAQGQNPACVDACPMRAIQYGELEELQAIYGTAVNAIEPLPSAKYTEPSLLIKPHKDAEVSGAGTGRILNLPEEL